MAKARRLYLYLVSWLALLVLVAAEITILRLILSHAGIGPLIIGSTTLISLSDKDTLAVGLTLLLVGLGLWLFHWGTLERMTAGDDDEAAEERASVFRSVYFSITLGLSFVSAALLWISLLTDAISDRLGAVPASSAADDDWLLTGAIVATAVWSYHVWVRLRDVRHGTPIRGAAAWTSRLYLYGAAAVGVLGMVLASSSMISTVLTELSGVGRPGGLDFGGLDLGVSTGSSSTPWWVRSIVAGIVGFVVWLVAWWAHWACSNRICKSPTVLAEPERRSRIRLAYPMLVVVLATSLVGSMVIAGLSTLLSAFLLGSNLNPLWYYVVQPMLVAIPFAAAWWWHRRRAIRESATGPAGVSANRVAGYLTAWVGLNLWGAGAALLVLVGLDRLFPTTSMYGLDAGPFADVVWKTELALGASYMAVGLPIWVFPWLSAHRRRAADWAAEARSSSRSFYLYLVEANWIVILALGVGLALYRYLRVALGLPEPGLAGEVEQPLGLALVAASLVAFHYRVMRRDVLGPPPAPAMATQPPYPPTAYPPTGYPPTGSPPAGYPPTDGGSSNLVQPEKADDSPGRPGDARSPYQPT